MSRIRLGILAGALASSVALLGLPGTPATAGHQSGPYFDLSVMPPVDYTGDQIFEGLKRFVADYPLRITGTPNEIRAGKYLADEMGALGYETSINSLGQNTTVNSCSPGPTCVGAGLKAITAMKRGTSKPDEWIMFIGHYDAVPQTVEGAYDNGAGTNFIRYLAHEFKNVQTNRSLVFVWYNGEEQGLLASARHAQQLANSSQAVAAVLGFDMVGIAWPVKTPGSTSCLCIFRGLNDGPKFTPLIDYVNFTYLGFPSGVQKVRNMGQNTRNSDESAFASRGFPTLRWAGMTTAASYNGYHNTNDTIANINAVAGGTDDNPDFYYEAGIHNTLRSVYYTTLALDNHAPVPQGTAEVGSDLTVGFDGSGTVDIDGAPAAYDWDYGDGNTGSGISALHTYTIPGVYTVTLTVTDNLWGAVKRSTTFPVTVV